MRWTFQWGKVYNTLALTGEGDAYHVKLFFSYELMKENSALITVLLMFSLLWIVTGLTGTVLFALSVCVGRTAAMFTGTFFAVLSVVFANLYIWQAWIGFLSPLSWIGLLLLYGKVCRPAPSFAMICIMAVVLGIILYILFLKAVQTKDLDWIEEE